MTNPPDPSRVHVFRWRAVLISFLLIIGTVGYLLAAVWQQNRTLDDRVQRGLERSHRIETAVDSVRQPVCTIMFAALSRPVAGLTPEQLEARALYYRAYGPGTPDQPGLNCPRPLPQAR